MPEMEIFVSKEEITTELEKASVGAYMGSLANAKTPMQAKEMFQKRLEQKKTGWADKQTPKINYTTKILAVFKDIENGIYWNAVVKEKINDLERTLLFYSSKGQLKKRSLSAQEQQAIKQASITAVTQEQPTVTTQEQPEVKQEQPSKAEQQQAKQEQKRAEKLKGKRK